MAKVNICRHHTRSLLQAKTGIANRALRPLLGIVDPLHTKWDFRANFAQVQRIGLNSVLLKTFFFICRHMPERVAAFSGFDVLCHALGKMISHQTEDHDEYHDLTSDRVRLCIPRVLHRDPIHCSGSSACCPQPETSLPGGQKCFSQAICSFFVLG